MQLSVLLFTFGVIWVVDARSTKSKYNPFASPSYSKPDGDDKDGGGYGSDRDDDDEPKKGGSSKRYDPDNLNCRVEAIPEIRNRVECAYHVPKFLRSLAPEGYCYWDVQMEACMCPRQEAECKELDHCIWKDSEEEGLEKSECITKAEQFYILLGKRLSRRGKKDLFLSIAYNSKAAQGYLPQGPWGKHIIAQQLPQYPHMNQFAHTFMPFPNRMSAGYSQMSPNYYNTYSHANTRFQNRYESPMQGYQQSMQGYGYQQPMMTQPPMMPQTPPMMYSQQPVQGYQQQGYSQQPNQPYQPNNQYPNQQQPPVNPMPHPNLPDGAPSGQTGQGVNTDKTGQTGQPAGQSAGTGQSTQPAPQPTGYLPQTGYQQQQPPMGYQMQQPTGYPQTGYPQQTGYQQQPPLMMTANRRPNFQPVNSPPMTIMRPPPFTGY